MALLIDHQAVLRVRAALVAANHPTEIVSLSNTARTAGMLRVHLELKLAKS
jgi:hypothetical protein